MSPDTLVSVFLRLHAATQPADARQIFEQGQLALNSGDLPLLRRHFRQVLEAEPNNVGAHGNLAVVYMRRREWKPALAELRAAERLAPNVPGIRLNIGLVYFRQADYPHAIPPFESVMRDQRESRQARYLLGLCYFFTERYTDTVQTLQPLWPQESRKSQLPLCSGHRRGQSRARGTRPAGHRAADRSGTGFG